MRVFVGRQAELATLDSGLAAARLGDGGLVLVHGGPGMGKTALAAEATRLAAAAGMRTCWGGCAEGTGGPAYRPWAQVLAGLGAPADVLIDGAGSRFQLFDEMVRLLRTEAEPYGLLVVIDDLHNADLPSLRLLQVLASAVAGSRLFVIGLYRRAEALARAELKTVLRERATSTLPLGGLSADEVAELARHTLDCAPSPALLAAVQRRAEGNPLFTVELVRLAAGAPSMELPTSVREVIAGRLDLLSPGCRRALRAASVLGGEFTAARLAELAGAPMGDAAAEAVAAKPVGLEEAVAAELVARLGGGGYRFTHVLVQEVAYGELPEAARQVMHLRAARSSKAHDSPDTLAHHLRQAATLADDEELLAEALSTTLLAAERAGRQFAYEHAAFQYRQALDLLGAGTTRAELLLELARCEFRSGAVADAWRTCQAAADLGRAHGDATTVAEAALIVRGLSNDPICDQIHALSREALTMIGTDHPVLAARLLGQHAVTANQWAGGIEAGLSERALLAAEATGDPDARFLALQARCVALTDPRFTLDRLAIGERAVQLGQETGREDYLAWGHCWRADAFWQLSRRVQLDAELTAYAGVVAHLREPLARWRLTMMRASVALLEGRFARATELADEALAIGRRGGHEEAGFFRVVFDTYLVPMTGGDLTGAESFVRQVVQQGNVLVRAWLAGLLADMDRLDEAAAEWAAVRPHLTEFPRYTQEWLVNTASTVDLCVQLDDVEILPGLYADLLPFAGGQVTGGAHTPSMGPVALYLGKVAIRLGDLAAAHAHLSTSLRICAAMGAAPHEAMTHVELARLMLARREPADLRLAEEHLTTATTIATRLGMATLVQRADALRERLPGGRSGPLSPRQQEIAGLVADGLSNRQIAERLYLSERTVETHVRAILLKLGFESRSRVASWFTSRAK